MIVVAKAVMEEELVMQAAVEELVVVPGERGGVLAVVEEVKAVVEMMATMKEVLVEVEDMLTRVEMVLADMEADAMLEDVQMDKTKQE